MGKQVVILGLLVACGLSRAIGAETQTAIEIVYSCELRGTISICG